MNCAVRDGAIAVNPCQIRGAGKDMATEHPIASPAEIVELVDAITAAISGCCPPRGLVQVPRLPVLDRRHHRLDAST